MNEGKLKASAPAISKHDDIEVGESSINPPSIDIQPLSDSSSEGKPSSGEPLDGSVEPFYGGGITLNQIDFAEKNESERQKSSPDLALEV